MSCDKVKAQTENTIEYYKLGYIRKVKQELLETQGG